MDQQKTNKCLIAGASIVLIVAIIAGVVFYSRKEVNAPSTITGQINTPEPTTIASYRDGIYNAKGVYTSPAGSEQIDVKLTLKDGTVTDAMVVIEAINPVSKNFQEKFASGYKTLVIGKSIAALSLDKVSGSSLTPKGFNDAVTKIKSQAKS